MWYPAVLADRDPTRSTSPGPSRQSGPRLGPAVLDRGGALGCVGSTLQDVAISGAARRSAQSSISGRLCPDPIEACASDALAAIAGGGPLQGDHLGRWNLQHVSVLFNANTRAGEEPLTKVDR